MDVLQRQVDEYEQSMRSSLKSPKGVQRTRRSGLPSPDLTSPRRASLDGAQSTVTTSGLEAALLRPALQAALHDAVVWKSLAVSAIALDLPPLQPTDTADDLFSTLSTLASARSHARIQKATVSVVDLSAAEERPMASLITMKAGVAAAEDYLEDVTISATRWLSGIQAG